MFIIRATAVTDELMDAIGCLVPQLKLKYSLPAREEIEALVGSKASILLVARYPDEYSPIIGFLTLVIYRVPTGIRARIEDVVVDEAMRGKGIGEALVRRGLNMALDAGADGVALTSNPKREAANKLYQKLGFKRWKTNLYFYEFLECQNLS
jgi:ribosomal protein S18 acetylase RimI-like enzyme